ncbi:DUF4292 domain-containing protein [Algivirga pacifica]|uniref:DUF4292 domain-containing protein n=1 Tax=Algivirga pacifica TaxID=1162670 RepID=A0ABP9DGB0_9BACT
MFRIIKNILFIFALLISFSACRKDVSKQKKVKSKIFALQPLDFKYFTAKGKAIYEANKDAVNVSMEVHIAKDSAVWVSLRTAGIEGLRILATKDSIQALNRLAREYYVISYDELEDLTDIPYDYALFEGIFTGNIPPQFELKSKAIMTEDHFLLRNKRGDYKINLYVSRTLQKLERLFIEKKRGDQGADLAYKNFKLVDDESQQLFPYHSELRIGESDNFSLKKVNMKVNLQYNKIKLEDKSPKFSFAVSPRYKVVKPKQLRLSNN